MLWLSAVIVLAVVLAFIGGATGGLAQTSRTTAEGARCTLVQTAGVGVDVGIPLIKTGARERCDFTDTPAGQLLTVANWILQIFAWASATLFIAGFTSAVRKT